MEVSYDLGTMLKKLILLGSLIGTVACGSSPALEEANFDESPDTVLVEEGYVSNCPQEEAADVELQGGGDEEEVVNEDSETLDCRIDFTDQTLEILAGQLSSSLGDRNFLQAVSPNQLPLEKRLRLHTLATVRPPKVNGASLGATEVFFDGTYALVTYNTAGATYRGGLQLLDLRNPRRPRMLTEIVLSDTDVSTAYVDLTEPALYLVGAQSVGLSGFSTPAIVRKISLSSGLLPDAFSQLEDLSSFVATDAILVGSNLFVTTGNTGGLEKLVASNLQSLDFLSLDDARSVTFNENDGFLYVYQGTSGRVTAVNPNDFSDNTTYNTGGATLPESKGTIEYNSDQQVLIVAAGDGGAQMISPLTGMVLDTLVNPNISTLNSDVQVTNAVSAFGDMLFVSNGEAGIRLAQFSQAGGIDLIGTLDFPQDISANGMAYHDKILVIAAGTGGVRIVKTLTRPYLTPHDCTLIQAVFCDDFARSDGLVINDDQIWQGKVRRKPNGYIIQEGGRLLAKRAISSLTQFDHGSVGKHYSLKMFASGSFFVKSVKKSNVGIQLNYLDQIDSSQARVEARIGLVPNKNKRHTLRFDFPLGQEFIVCHVFQQGEQIQVAIELPDGTMMESSVVASNQKGMSDLMELQLSPFPQTQTQTEGIPAFDDVLVEDFDF